MGAPSDLATSAQYQLTFGWFAPLSGTLTFLVAMGLFLAALGYLSAGFASSFLRLTPVFSPASAFLLLGEVLTGWQWIGVLIILMSVLGIQYGNSNSEDQRTRGLDCRI